MTIRIARGLAVDDRTALAGVDDPGQGIGLICRPGCSNGLCKLRLQRRDFAGLVLPTAALRPLGAGPRIDAGVAAGVLKVAARVSALTILSWASGVRFVRRLMAMCLPFSPRSTARQSTGFSCHTTRPSHLHEGDVCGAPHPGTR